jgi:DinB family protein
MPRMSQRRPDPSEHASGWGYIDLVQEIDIIGAMERQSDEMQKMLAGVDESRADFRYAPGKWSIKQVVGHIEDAERVFAYRALSIARGTTASLPGFDENTWMQNSPFESTSLVYRAESLLLVRKTTIAMFRDLEDEAWNRRGTANEKPASVRALAYMIVGHERHHMGVLRERYGIAT